MPLFYFASSILNISGKASNIVSILEEIIPKMERVCITSAFSVFNNLM